KKNSSGNRNSATRRVSVISDGALSPRSYSLSMRVETPIAAARSFFVNPRRRRARSSRAGLKRSMGNASVCLTPHVHFDLVVRIVVHQLDMLRERQDRQHDALAPSGNVLALHRLRTRQLRANHAVGIVEMVEK